MVSRPYTFVLKIKKNELELKIEFEVGGHRTYIEISQVQFGSTKLLGSDGKEESHRRFKSLLPNITQFVSSSLPSPGTTVDRLTVENTTGVREISG